MPTAVAARERIGRRRFELAKRAYVEARYSKHYQITDEELEWIAESVAVLEALVRTVCERRLAAPLDPVDDPPFAG